MDVVARQYEKRCSLCQFADRCQVTDDKRAVYNLRRFTVEFINRDKLASTVPGHGPLDIVLMNLEVHDQAHPTLLCSIVSHSLPHHNAASKKLTTKLLYMCKFVKQ